MDMQTSLFPHPLQQPSHEGPRQAELGQYMTAPWAAEALIELHFADLSADDRVLEPSCGTGAFLNAIPDYVPAVGVEIDPALAALARRNTGREVILGDFRTAQLPFQPTAVIGNPPFAKDAILALLERSWELLPEEGRVGLIMPAFVLATPTTVDTLAQKWLLEQSMLPRTLWPRLQHPLCFAILRKGQRRGLIGFSLYHEAAAVRRIERRYRALLQAGEGSVWAAVTRAALEACGGRATLQQLYDEIEGHRPTANRFWQAKVRQMVQRIAVRVGPGQWQIADAPREEAA